LKQAILVCAAAASLLLFEGAWAKSATGASACRADSQFGKTDALLVRARAAIQARRFRSAITLLDQGLSSFGWAYYGDDNLIDDTGLKLALAISEARNGKLERAANLKAGVLRSRLVLYAEKHGCPVPPR
jgi:hypothetical protein